MATRSRFSLAVLVAVGASLLALPTTAPAVHVRGGKAKISLAPAFQRSLADKGVTVSPTGAAKRKGDRLKFKIRRGNVNPQRQRAQLRLRGGLRWSEGDFTGEQRHADAAGQPGVIFISCNKARVVVRGQRGHISARAENADRQRLFKLSDVRFRNQGRRITAKVSLAAVGALSLNQALDLGAEERFKPREPVGAFLNDAGHGYARSRSQRAQAAGSTSLVASASA